MAPHRYLVVDVTVNSARASSNVPTVGAPLPLPGSLATGSQHGKLDVDLRSSASYRASLSQSDHAYHPFALEVGGRRLAPIAVEMNVRLAIFVTVL
jgi:hypothetical protein